MAPTKEELQRQHELTQASTEQQREAQEGAKLNALKADADKIGSSPEKTPAALIEALDGKKEWKDQIEGLTALEKALAGILGKLAKKGVKIDQDNDPEKLRMAVSQNNLTLDLAEASALENLNRIASGSGSTSKYVRENWPKTVETGKEASKGFGEKYMEHYRKNPSGTIFLTIAGAAGMYLALSNLKGLWDKASGNEPLDKADDKTFFKKKLMIPLAIMLAGGFLGKDVIKKILADAGFDYFKLEAEAATGKISEETKQKMEEGGPVVAAAVERVREEVKVTEVTTTSEETGNNEPKVESTDPKTQEEIVKELLENNKYEGAQTIFLNLYFRQREYTVHHKNLFARTINDLAKEKFSVIKSIYEKNKEVGVISRTGLPDIKQNIGDKHLFLVVEGMIKMERLTGGSKNPEMTVKQLFETAGDNPFFGQLDGLSSGLGEALKKGDIGGALESIGAQGIDLAKNAGGLIKKLDEELGMKLEELTPEEKTKYREIQILMLNNSAISQDATGAIDNILINRADLQPFTNSTQLAKEFFEKVQGRTPNILTKIHAHYEIKIDGEPNYIVEAIDFSTLTFASACEFVALEKLMDSQEDSASQILLLNSILRAFNDPSKKNIYTTLLVTELGKEVPQIPGAQKLKGYFNELTQALGGYATRWLLEWMERAHGFGADHATRGSSENFAEKVKNNNFILTFGQEAVGAPLEATSDVVAGIILAFGLEDQMASCETGKDFLELIRINGGNIAVTEGRDGVGMVIIEGAGEIFVMRPGKILYESLISASDMSLSGLGEVTKLVAVGSAPFVVYGGVKGLLTVNVVKKIVNGEEKLIAQTGILPRVWNAMKGGARGMTYPIEAPLMAARGVRNTAQAIASRTEAIKATGRGISTTGERIVNWTKDVIKGMPGPNVENMVITENLLARHFRMIENAEPTYIRIYPKDYAILKSLKRFAMKTADGYKHAKRMMVSPIQTLTYDFHFRKTAQYAERLGKSLNDFFEFEGKNGFEFNELDYNEIRRIMQMQERLRGFAEYAKKNPALVNDIVRLAGNNKGENIYTAVLKRLTESSAEMGLEITEQEALARRIKNDPEKVKQIFDQLEAGRIRHGNLPAAPSKPTKAEKKSGPRKNPGSTDTPDRSFGKVTDEIKKAGNQIKEIERQILSAQKEINATKEAALRPGANLDQLQAKIDQARDTVQRGVEARRQLQTALSTLDEVARAEAGMKGVTDFTTDAASRLSVDLLAKTEAAENALRASSEALTGFNTEPGKLAKSLKYAGRGFAIGGAVLSFYEAGKSGHEAWTTTVDGRSAIKGAEAGMWASNAIVDSAAVAVMFGVEGAAASGAAALAAPLIPLTYVGSTVFDTLNEDTKTDYEWVQENPYKLLHDFYTTAHSVSLGDAWVAGFKAEYNHDLEGNVKERFQKKDETLYKIYRGLVAIQNSPRILDYIATEPSSEEKNREIEKRINENYTENHEFYFRHGRDTVSSYEEAQKVILEGQMFDDIMEMRKKAKETGQTFVLGGTHLESSDYDIPDGKGWSLEKAPFFTPYQVVEAFKQDALKTFEFDPVVSANLERVDTAYLLRLYAQSSMLLVEVDREIKTGGLDEVTLKEKEIVGKFLKTQMTWIENYLKIKRSVNFEFAVRQQEHSEPRMSLNTLHEHLDSLGRLENKVYLEFEKVNYETTPAVYSLYKLAEHFGYGGSPSEEKLKAFFTESTWEAHGIYWNGETWMLSERGLEMDDEMGSILSTAMIQRVIKRMREQPDNILKHRGDNKLFYDAYDFTKNVEKMADILKNGLAEGNQRGYKMSRAEATSGEVTAPKELNTKPVDYKKTSEELKNDLARTIVDLKEKAGWTKLQYQVVNEGKIILSRSDSPTKANLIRKGGNWILDGVTDKEFTIDQAIALGNLKNHAENYIKTNRLEGESTTPFYLNSSGGISFAESWGVDNEYLKGSGWLDSYKSLDIKKEDILLILNETYRKI